MKSVNRQQTNPVSWSRSKRVLPIDIGTSLPVGKVVPVYATSLLRQDSLNARVNFGIEMMETNELLANKVGARVSAYVVPNTALERFEKSRDQFDRSYMGQPQVDGGSVVPYFDFAPMGAPGADKIYQYIGLHADQGDQVETRYAEAYNLIHNFRLRNRSRDLPLRTNMTDTSLAPAFWDLGRFRHVLPDFDEAVMEGEVALNVVSEALPVKGLGTWGTPNSTTTATFKETDATGVSSASILYDEETPAGGLALVESTVTPGFPAVYAEMVENGITVSLANIEMARKMQSYAKIKERFTGLSDDEADEYIIDMLMSGLRIPDQAMMQPILVGQQMLTFSQAKRNASDGDNMDKSMVSGFLQGSMNIRVPELDVGGTVMIVVECFPQQLFEKQADPIFNCYEQVQGVEAGKPQTDWLPEALRDSLDPQKVDVVRNDQIDTGHATGATTFGYAPLNWQWSVAGPRLGGKFYRGVAATSDRQRFWAAETVDPELGPDFYLVPDDLQTDIFVRSGDPFEMFGEGSAAIRGITQFGGLLVEATENYEKVEDKMDTDRIEQEAS